MMKNTIHAERNVGSLCCPYEERKSIGEKGTSMKLNSD